MDIHKKPKPGKKVAVYLRVSSKGQATDGQGLDVQYEICKGIIEQNQWIFYKVYYNPDGISGDVKAKNRPEFVKMLEDGKSKKFSIVMVSVIDRFGRQSRIIEKAIQQIFDAGLKLYVGTMPIQNTHVGIFFAQMISNVAQLDKLQLIDRMNYGFEQANLERGVTKGTLPYGYKKIGKGRNTRIEIVDDQANVIRRIYKETFEGFSQRRIADGLNNDNIKAPRSKDWSQAKIRQILAPDKEENYRGGMRNRWNRSGYCWPKILEESNIPVKNDEQYDSGEFESEEFESEEFESEDEPFSPSFSHLPVINIPLPPPIKLPPLPKMVSSSTIVPPKPIPEPEKSPIRAIPNKLPPPSPSIKFDKDKQKQKNK